MDVVNIHEAKTHLSRLVADAAAGRPFVIAKAGKPLVKVVPYNGKKPRRLGFMNGEGRVDVPVKEVGRDEIEEMFYGGDA